LLTRGRLEEDRRRHRLALTEQGEWVLRSAQTALCERLAGLLSDLPPPEADALARLLERLEASLSGTPPPPRPHRPPPPGHGPKHRRHP
jgi:DNA-binding MarR family transcriptional regulator